MKTFKVTAQRNGTRVPSEVGEAIENRDGSISVRMKALDLPFDGRLTLHPVVEGDATVIEPRTGQPRIAFATIGPPPPGAVEAYNAGQKLRLKEPQPPHRDPNELDHSECGHVSGLDRTHCVHGTRGRSERVPYLAIRCSCKGSKPQHEPIGDFGLLCSVPADSVKR